MASCNLIRIKTLTVKMKQLKNSKEYLKLIKFYQIRIKECSYQKKYDRYGDSNEFDDFHFKFENPFQFFKTNMSNGFFSDDELNLFGGFGMSNFGSIFKDDFFNSPFDQGFDNFGGSGFSTSKSTSKSTKIVNGCKVTVTKTTTKSGNKPAVVKITEETVYPNGKKEIKHINKGSENIKSLNK